MPSVRTLRPMWALALAIAVPPSFAQDLGSSLELLSTLDPAAQAALTSQLAGVNKSSDSATNVGQPQSSASESLVLAQIERAEAARREAERQYQPADTVIVQVSLADKRSTALTDGEKRELGRLIELIQSRNPFTLTNDGALVLPGFGPIPLSGLNDEQASLRLSNDPSLLKLDVRVAKLPVRRLKPFGYELFRRLESPLGSLRAAGPAPADYRLAAGDQLRVQLFGSQNRIFNLVVNRDGDINFPELGPISVAGNTLNAASAEIEKRVEQQIIGSKVSISLGRSRGVQVFVVGETEKPGAFNLAENATITAALFAAGGVKETGSLRDIQIKRGGAIVGRLDLYDLLLRGDTSADVALLEGDAVLVPPVGPTLSVEGEVRRPAVYELRGPTSVMDAVQIAGGLTPSADRSRLVLAQTDGAQRRVLTDVATDSDASRRASVGNGDTLRVLALRPVVDSAVGIEGHVYRTGLIAWREGLRLADVLTSMDELKPNADVEYVLIRRERPTERRVEMLSASLTQALANRDSDANVALVPRDRVIVLDQAGGRRQLLDPLIIELRGQSTLQQPTAVVTVAGQVKAPGDYPLEINMRVSDLLRAGGRLQDSAYGASAELARRRFAADRWETELLAVDLSAILKGDEAADIRLEPGDALIVKQAPEWSTSESVTIRGEVRFPGTYPIRRGETLRSVIERAGGLTPLANPGGSVFTREELRALEQREIERLTERLRRDLAATALLNLQAAGAQGGGGGASAGLALVQNLINQFRDITPVGRLVIDLNRVLSSRVGSSEDVVLRAGDQLMVPKFRQEVSVIGEVQNTTAHLYRSNYSLDDYVALSGGTSTRADKKRIFVVRADGSVRARSGQSWWRVGGSAGPIRPGDTIVVPLDTESLPTLAQVQLWQAATSILYNSAVAVAAIQGL